MNFLDFFNSKVEMQVVLSNKYNKIRTLRGSDPMPACYDALNRMYKRAIDKVLALHDEQQNEFRQRLKAIMTSSSNIGWGYHDTLADDYYSAFDDDE